MEQIMESIVNGVAAVVITIVGVAAVYLIDLVKKSKNKIEVEVTKIKDEQAKAVVNDIVDKLDNLVVEAIHYTEQNIVKEIKDASEDGKLTLEEGKGILTNTALNVYDVLSYDAVKALESVYGDVVLLIQNKTQKIFNELKKKGEI